MNTYEYRDNLGNPRDYYDIVNDATKLCEEIEKKDKEIERLNNIIDELERFLKYEIYCDFNKEMTKGYQDTLDKLKELKGGE